MFIVKSKYRVVRVLTAQRDYAALEAVNIEERNNTEVLLNVYEGESKKRYIRLFSAFTGCRDFVECFISDESFVAAFKLTEGDEIDEVFNLDSKFSPEDRIYYADRLLGELLRISDLPYDISCSVMLSENILFDLGSRDVRFRWRIEPLPEANERELNCLVGDQLDKIFPRRVCSADSERRFIDTLKSGKFTSFSALYSYWLEEKTRIEDEYRMIGQKNAIAKYIYYFWHYLKRKFGKKTPNGHN